MKKFYTKVFETTFNSKKILRIVIPVLTAIVIYYSVTGGIFLLYLLPLIFMWLMGADGVEFFNVTSSKEIQRTDISYFTTGDISDGIKIILIIVILVFVVRKLMKIEKNYHK